MSHRNLLASLCATACSSSPAHVDDASPVHVDDASPVHVDDASPADTGLSFSTPETVTVKGYSGPQEDPVISADGNYLFFDTHDDAGDAAHLYAAMPIDYKTFQFTGEIQGLSDSGGTGQIEGAEDSSGNFYFISNENFGTIKHGIFSNGTVSDISSVAGVPPPAPSPGDISGHFDLFISPDGNELYFSDFEVSGNGMPQSAHLAVASRNADGSFTQLDNSDAILQAVNAMGQIVYNATPSADGLLIAFNAASYGQPDHLLVAMRSSTSDPWGAPQIVSTAEALPGGGPSEPGSISPDGAYLYFHRVLSANTSQLYVLKLDQTFASNLR